MTVLRTGLHGHSGPGVVSTPSMGGGAAVIGFVPTDIPNFGLWLRADRGTFTDVAMTIPAIVNGAAIGGWQDQSGSGNHATQAVAAQQPNLQLTIVNGMPVVRYTIANQDFLEILTGAVLGITDTVTTFFVQYPITTGIRQTTLGHRNLANAFQQEVWSAGLGDRRTIIPGVFVTITNNVPGPGNAWEVLTYRRAGAGAGTHTWRWNGVNVALAVVNANAYAANGIKDIGRRAAASQHFSGDFAEILVYTTNLTDVQILQVEGWLNARYAIY